jgi:hypothetical protein
MAHSVTIASGKKAVNLPNGFAYDAGTTVLLTDEQYANLNQALIPGYVVDNGVVSDVGDDVITQGAAVAAQGALTSSAPAALTSVAITGGESPTEAEHNALLTDITALRTTLAAVQVDLAATRTKLNAALAALTGAGKPLHV